MTREELDLDWYHGHVRSLVILDRKGLIGYSDLVVDSGHMGG